MQIGEEWQQGHVWLSQIPHMANSSDQINYLWAPPTNWTILGDNIEVIWLLSFLVQIKGNFTLLELIWRFESEQWAAQRSTLRDQVKGPKSLQLVFTLVLVLFPTLDAKKKISQIWKWATVQGTKLKTFEYAQHLTIILLLETPCPSFGSSVTFVTPI